MFKKFTFLLVEDDSEMQEYMSKILKDECEALYLASDGEEGLSLYKTVKPDIVITDLNMPKMNGLEMSKEIKHHNKYQPIILLTAFGEAKYLKDAINIGVDSFVEKPIESIEILFETIQLQIEKLGDVNELNLIRNSKKNNDRNSHHLLNDILQYDPHTIDYDICTNLNNQKD